MPRRNPDLALFLQRPDFYGHRSRAVIPQRLLQREDEGRVDDEAALRVAMARPAAAGDVLALD